MSLAGLDRDTIRRLAAFKTPGRPVVSAYLDVDGRRWPRFADCVQRLERMARDAADGVDGSAAEDLQRILSHVRAGSDRGRTRGTAVFACGPELWETFSLPVRVKDQLVVNQTPHVRQLEAVVDNYPGFGVLLVDKQRARMLVFELNELVDRRELFDALPRGEDEAGDRDRGTRHPAEPAVRQHLRRAAAAAFEEWKQHPFDHLILGAPPELVNEVEGLLHTYLRNRVAARVNVSAAAPEAEVTAAALAVEEQVERDREAARVSRLRAAASAGRGGVVGLEATLAALSERRVDLLVVSEEFEASGWRCLACRHLAEKGRRCPACGQDMVMVDDIAEEAVEEALLQSCQVEMCVGNADLDVVGGIGALLRF